MFRFKSRPDHVFTNYREVNAVNLVGTGTLKSKFVHMPNSVNTFLKNIGWAFFLSTLGVQFTVRRPKLSIRQPIFKAQICI